MAGAPTEAGAGDTRGLRTHRAHGTTSETHKHNTHTAPGTPTRTKPTRTRAGRRVNGGPQLMEHTRPNKARAGPKEESEELEEE